MKITARQYAKALAEALEGVDEQSGKKIVRNFVETVGRKRQTKLFGSIIRNLSEICKKREGKIEAEVVSAFPLEDKERDSVIDFLVGKFSKNKSDILIEEKIDPSVVGGFVISSEGCVWDMSVKGSIDRLEKTLK